MNEPVELHEETARELAVSIQIGAEGRKAARIVMRALGYDTDKMIELLREWRAHPSRVGRHRKAWNQWVGALAMTHGVIPETTPPEMAGELAYRLRKSSVLETEPAEVYDLCDGKWPTEWGTSVRLPFILEAHRYKLTHAALVEKPTDCQLLSPRDRDLRIGRITSSIVAWLLGLHPKYGEINAWMAATGRAPFEDNVAARLGRRYEEPAREEFLFQNPELECRVIGTIAHPIEHEWAADSPDGLLFKDGELFAVLEIKHRHFSKGWGPSGTSEVPLDVVAQCAWHCWVCGVNRCYVYRVTGLSDATYVLEFTDELLSEVVTACKDFWEKYVKTDTAPPADAKPATLKALKRLYAEETGEVLPPTMFMAELVEKFERWTEERKRRAEAVKEAKGYCDRLEAALLRILEHGSEIEGIVKRKRRRGRVSYRNYVKDARLEDEAEAYRGEDTFSLQIIRE